MCRIITPINAYLPVVTPRRGATCIVMERFDVMEVLSSPKYTSPNNPASTILRINTFDLE